MVELFYMYVTGSGSFCRKSQFRNVRSLPIFFTHSSLNVFENKMSDIFLANFTLISEI